MTSRKQPQHHIEPLYKVVGNIIRKNREKLKLPQLAVAEKLGISRASLANIELGRQRITLSDAFELASILHFSLDSLQEQFRSDSLTTKVQEQPRDIQEKLTAIREQFRSGGGKK